ncbi:GNAT family N-acetyltransferase [Geodermatophilus sp. SYSU D00697]
MRHPGHTGSPGEAKQGRAARRYRSSTHVDPRQRRRGERRWNTSMETSVVDVPDRGRFEVRLGDEVVGLASYHVEDGTMALPHTEVDPSVGGRGIGKALVKGVLAAARERGLHVLPYCSFVRHYIQQHPEELDLVAEADRPHFGLETADR